MSNYSRVEVNLVPPELLPPPSLRLAVLANLLLILGTLAFMGVGAMLRLYPISSTRQSIEEKKLQVASKVDIAETHAELVEAREGVDRYGRIVALASADYVEIPVLMDRLARIIPDGVYLVSVSNEKPAPGAGTTIVQVQMKASSENLDLPHQTLEAFKQDLIFHDCFMPNARWQQESIDSQLASYGVDWTVTGPDVPTAVSMGQYAFEIRANISKPLDAGYLPLVEDYSMHLAQLKAPPPSEPEGWHEGGEPAGAAPAPDGEQETGEADGAAPESAEAAEAPPPSNAPEGVTVEEVR